MSHADYSLITQNFKELKKRHKSPDITLSDEPSSSKFTRRSCSASTEEGPLHLEECFICEKKASRTELREALTM